MQALEMIRAEICRWHSRPRKQAARLQLSHGLGACPETTSRRRATSQTDAPGAKASATIDRFCSALHGRRRSGPDSTSTPIIAPSLAPVQITVLARKAAP